MEGYHTFLVRGDDFGTFLQAAHNAVHSIEEILFGDNIFVVPCGDEGCLVAHVGDVGTRKTGSLARQEIFVNAVVELEAAHVDFENLLTFFYIRKFHINLTVETSGAQQSFVEDVGTVGGGHNDNTCVGTETVHLGQQLV